MNITPNLAPVPWSVRHFQRGDTLEHRRACIHDTIREPEVDWPWWLDYWQGVMARGREA